MMGKNEARLHFRRLTLGRARSVISGAGLVAGIAAAVVCLLTVTKSSRAAQGGRA